MLWHGGFRSSAQYALAAMAGGGVLLFAGRWRATPLLAGLVLAAVANLASLAWHHDSGSLAPTLAAVAVSLVVAVADLPGLRLCERLPLVVALLAATIATSGLAGLALRVHPLAERIQGVWRAEGTLEYPPALGLLCVCGLAAALALHAGGSIDRASAVVLCALMGATAMATFDRVAAGETIAVLALFALRVPSVRRTIALVAAASIGCALLALIVSHPSRAALERHLRHGAISSRTTVWDAAWHAARARPLLGYGPGQFRAIYANSSTPPARQIGLAHNAVLEQAVEAGVVAAAATALALAAMLLAGARALVSREPARLSAAVAATAVALSGLYDITWSFAPLLVLGAVSAVACGGRLRPM